MEKEDFECIPGGEVYIKGFLKTYTKFLKIEDQEEVKDFINKKFTNNKERHWVEVKAEKTKGISKKYFLIPLFGVFFLFVIFWGIGYFNNEVSKSNNEPVNSNPSVVNDTGSKKDEGTSNYSGMEKKQNISLTVKIVDLTSKKEKCWIQVFCDGTLNYEGTLIEGDNKTFEAKENIDIKIGNAGVVKLQLGDKDLGFPGKMGEVVNKSFTKDDLD